MSSQKRRYFSKIVYVQTTSCPQHWHSTMGTCSPSICPQPVSNARRYCPSRVKWFASRHPQCPHCHSISRACPPTRRGSRFPRPSFTVSSASQNSVSRGLIAPRTASCSCLCTPWMIALRSSPFSFPATNCILIVLNAPPDCRCDGYQLLYHLEALQLSFFSCFHPFFPTLSHRYATAGVFDLQNLPKCAILSWHAGIAPEIGFSAPSMEQLW